MSEPTVTEEAAAEMIGIRGSEVKRLRRKILLVGVDFIEAGKAVRITPEGLKKMAAAIEPATKESVGAIVVRIPDAPVVRELVVDATVPNPRLLLAHYAENGKIIRVRVRVRDSKMFTRGMTIPSCRMIQETLYSYEGRAPRVRGRWL